MVSGTLFFKLKNQVRNSGGGSAVFLFSFIYGRFNQKICRYFDELKLSTYGKNIDERL